jgi:cell division protein FtsN
MRGQRRGSRTGTFLVLTGIVGVLTATFVAGVWTGQHWPVLVGNPRSPVAAAEPVVPARRVPAERPRAEALPALTFYDELRAPLTPSPSPPAPRPRRPARPPDARREAAAAVPAPAAPGPGGSELPDPGTRFTIQVAAFGARTQAETLRATLASSGHEARVVESASETGVRYRVQVGTFPSRDAAREAAARLGAERSLSTFVTTR